MTDLHPSPESDRVAVADEAAEVTRRFRASTYEGAVEAATAELGLDIRVVAANRIRRGGLGGFFATDLGVEIAVVSEPRRGEPVVDRAGDRVGGDQPVEASDSPSAELEAVDEVLELSDEAMESLLREIEHSGSRNAAPSAGPPPELLSTFAEHLARERDAFPMVPGTAPTDGWSDSSDATMTTMPSVAEELRRQADEVSRAERAAGPHPVDAVETSEAIEAVDAVEPLGARGMEASTAIDESPTVERVAPMESSPELDRSPEIDALDELAAIEEIPRIDQIPLIDEANRPDGVGVDDGPILPERVITGAAASQLDDDADWQRVLEVQQEAAIRQESRRQEEARASLRREREMTFQTVVARRALVDRELAARVSSEYLGSVGAAAPTVEPTRTPDPVVAGPEPRPAGDPMAAAALAELDELLRRAGVRIPDETDSLTPDHAQAMAERATGTELATSATDHLVSRLAETVAVDGSCLEDLTRVSVAVTTPEGVMIEMVADVDGQDV